MAERSTFTQEMSEDHAQYTTTKTVITMVILVFGGAEVHVRRSGGERRQGTGAPRCAWRD